MKVVILAGGLGTRLSEETDIKPKPMVEVGGKPILWHIMKIYSYYGFNDFIVCLGYKSYIIKEYFINYYTHQSDIKIDLSNNKIETLSSQSENWKITLVDTGNDTMTGGRIKRIQKYVGDETFLLTYGDGLSNINIKDLVKFHKDNGKKLTVSAVQLEGRFGALKVDQNNILQAFEEKPKGDGNWISGGFFVCEPSVFDYIENDETIWERVPLEKLANENEIVAYKHNSFWRPMDTLKDKNDLNNFWNNNNALWKVWM
ncbi:MAG: glucose-1-phosphate cytidylyltransferase [Bacteroidota bacterium]|jgi:glucose-1-phosphate cytidylyltransferase